MPDSTGRWMRQARGRPARPSEQEKWRTNVWLAVRADRRQQEAADAERRRLRELPQKQAEQIARYEKQQRDPAAQRLRAEARQLEARRQADLTREVARIQAEKDAEEQARQALAVERGQLPGPDLAAERRALEILRAEYGWK